MLMDSARTDAFAKAIERQVMPGSNVVDLGAGTGFLSFLAAGKAGRVWGVERIPELADCAQGLIKLNGAQDKVEIIQGGCP